MKKTILATIAFAVATMPMTFAAQTPAPQPANGSQATKSTTKTRKHVSKKSTTKKSGSTTTPTGGK